MTTAEFPRPEDISLIVSDVDGTLLDSHHKLHPRTFHALKWLRINKPELPIVIATGKQRTSVREIRGPLDLDVFPASHLNGCVVYQPQGKVQAEVGLDTTVLVQLFHEFSAAKVSLFFYDREKVYELCGKDGPVWGDILRGYGEHVVSVDETFIDSITSGEIKIIKAAICTKGEELEVSRQALKEKYAANAFTMTQALPFCIELIPTTGSKGIALSKIIGAEIDPKKVIAFGDGENDVSMFKVAGYSVSMANAMPIASEHATHTTASNDEGGGKSLSIVT